MSRLARFLALCLGLLALAGCAKTIPYSTLEARYASPASRYMDLPGGLHVHYRDQGRRDGPVLVLVHGFSASLHAWEPWVQRLSPDYRIVSLDLPGHGLTRAPDDYVPSTANSVAVVGCGGVGLNVIQGARLAGAERIIAIDTRAAPLERARAFGATDVVQAATDDPRHEALVGRVRAMTAGRGVDHAFEATGIAALAFTPLLLARNGGNAVQVSGAHGEVAVPMTDFFWNKRYLTPLYGGCVPARDFPRLFDWVKSGAIEIDALITHHYRLEEAATAFDNMLNGRSGKGVFTIP